jgi:type IV pilus assembly protein PilA
MTGTGFDTSTHMPKQSALRPARLLQSRRGFTLIELMIVVAIVGVLAVLGTFSVRKYLANAKAAEARDSLGQIAKDASLAYERESAPTQASVLAQKTSTGLLHQLCSSASASIPAAATSIKAMKYQSRATDWSADQGTANKGFACLKFQMNVPQYYMYSYAASGSAAIGDSFTATAQGDLNGDQVLSLFQISGVIGSGHVVNVAPVLLEVRPED